MSSLEFNDYQRFKTPICNNNSPLPLACCCCRPIFLLQGGGTALLASTGVAGPYAAAAVRPWLATWAAESVWQCTFWTAPTPSETATNTRKAITLVPSAGFLLAAHAAMMSACAALRKDTAGKRSLLGALLIDLPTGLNAGWLAAASGIGVTLAAQVGPGALRKVATPEGGAALVYGLAGYGAVAAVALAAPHSILVSLGYSAATAWACNGIAKRPAVAPKVKRAAKRGVWISAFGALLSLAVCNGFALKNKK